MISSIRFKLLRVVYWRQPCGFVVAGLRRHAFLKVAMQDIFLRRKACWYSDRLVVEVSRQSKRLVLQISSVFIVQASSDFPHTKIFGSSCRCTHLIRCKKGVKRKPTTGNPPGQMTCFSVSREKKPENNNVYLCIYGVIFVWKSKGSEESICFCRQFIDGCEFGDSKMKMPFTPFVCASRVRLSTLEAN